MMRPSAPRGDESEAWQVDACAVSRIAVGSALLGAGGGGDPYLGSLAVRHLLDMGREIRIVPLKALADDAFIICVAGFGAPTVEAEKMLSTQPVVHALRTLEQRLGRQADALIAAEMGGGNSLIPLAAAAETGLPVVDGDGMGRAFPELQMTSYFLNGVSATPLVLTDEHLTMVACETPDTRKAETFARAATIEMGMQAYIAAYAMTGRQARTAVLSGTLSLAHRLGLAIEGARSGQAPIQTLVDRLTALMDGQYVATLFDGKVVDFWRSAERGFATGWCDLEALDGSGGTARVGFQNEYLWLRVDGRIRALAPDLICLVDRETAQPIPTPDVRYGQRVAVLGLSCHPVFRTEQALAVVGPAAFGIDETYVPIETLSAS